MADSDELSREAYRVKYGAWPLEPAPADDCEPRVRMVCATCGGENVMRDAWAEWDPDAGEWTLRSVFDHAHCDDCDGETSIEEVAFDHQPDEED